MPCLCGVLLYVVCTGGVTPDLACKQQSASVTQETNPGTAHRARDYGLTPRVSPRGHAATGETTSAPAEVEVKWFVGWAVAYVGSSVFLLNGQTPKIKSGMLGN